MRRGRRDERGSVSVWLVMMTVALVVIVGIAVDLGGQVHARQRAHDVASEAARAGAQQLTTADAMRGNQTAIDVSKGKAAALAYATAAGYRATVTLTTDDLLQVTVTGSYQPVFLGAVGVGTAPVTAHASARVVRVLNGTER